MARKYQLVPRQYFKRGFLDRSSLRVAYFWFSDQEALWRLGIIQTLDFFDKPFVVRCLRKLGPIRILLCPVLNSIHSWSTLSPCTHKTMSLAEMRLPLSATETGSVSRQLVLQPLHHVPCSKIPGALIVPTIWGQRRIKYLAADRCRRYACHPSEITVFKSPPPSDCPSIGRVPKARKLVQVYISVSLGPFRPCLG